MDSIKKYQNLQSFKLGKGTNHQRNYRDAKFIESAQIQVAFTKEILKTLWQITQKITYPFLQNKKQFKNWFSSIKAHLKTFYSVQSYLK